MVFGHFSISSIWLSKKLEILHSSLIEPTVKLTPYGYTPNLKTNGMEA